MPAARAQLESIKSVYITAQSPTGTELGSATGTLLRRGDGRAFLVTNRHVVTGLHQETNTTLSSTQAVPDCISAMIPTSLVSGAGGAAAPFWVFATIPLFGIDANPLWVEHPQLGRRADVVALPLTSQTAGCENFAYDVTKPPQVLITPAETVSVVGFPFGKTASDYFAIWATGFVATEPDIPFETLPVFLIDSRSRKGQSGSPVIFSRQAGLIPTAMGSEIYTGRVTDFLGIYSGRINEESDLGRVWKRSCLEELLEAAERRYPQ